MAIFPDYSKCTSLREMLLLNDKDILLSMASALGLSLSPRASVSFIAGKLEDIILNKPSEWLNFLPSTDLVLISKLIEIECVSFERSVAIAAPSVLPVVFSLNLVAFKLDKVNDNISYWLTPDLYESYSSVIDEVIELRKSQPYMLVDNLFWGTLANFGTFEKDHFLELLSDAFEPAGIADTVLDYFEHYIPQKVFYSEDDYYFNPLMTDDDLDLSFSLDNDEINYTPEISYNKLMVDGISYPNLFANPVYFDPADASVSMDRKYADLFDGEESLYVFLSECYYLVQNLVHFTADEVAMIAKEMKFEVFTNDLKSKVTRKQFDAAKMDVMLHMPILILNGHCIDEIKDVKLKFDISDDDFDEDDDFDSPYLKSEGVPSAPLFLNKVGRNDPCPCGSGLKYKNCHGKNLS